MQKLIYLFVAIFTTLLFNACEKDPYTDEGVVINGVIWATRNVGEIGKFVNKPEDFGNEYTWQEAKTACPSGWRLPTEWELKGLGTGTWTTNGREFGTAPNTIFLPADGWSNVGSGYYWSSTELSSDYARILFFYNNSIFMNHSKKTDRNSVRCVATMN